MTYIILNLNKSPSFSDESRLFLLELIRTFNKSKTIYRQDVFLLVLILVCAFPRRNSHIKGVRLFFLIKVPTEVITWIIYTSGYTSNQITSSYNENYKGFIDRKITTSQFLILQYQLMIRPISENKDIMIPINLVICPFIPKWNPSPKSLDDN